ncbi:MAG TPA: HD domain-containing protein [Nitrospirae bacterium]|nr:HD domain-containing protein [Nitrospirota bacterium]
MNDEIKVPYISKEELSQGESIFNRTVSELGEKQSIVAEEDIYSETGIKLVSSGTKIKNKIWEKIVNHKLIKPITESVSIENCLTINDIVSQAKSIIQNELFFVRLARSIDDPKYLLNKLKEINLPKPILNRLTVVRDARPRLYSHLLRTSIISAYFSFFHNLEPLKSDQLICASITHDMGEMHTDPKILEPNHIVTAEERRFIHVHPATGYFMLQNFPDLKGECAVAVLQHHERLDGSGYPSGLKGNEISILGQILSVAEVADALTWKFTSLKEIKVALNLNRKRFNTLFVDCLLQCVMEKEDNNKKNTKIKEKELKKRLSLISSVYDSTIKVSSYSENKEPLKSLNNRLKMFRYFLVEFGFDPNDHELLYEMNKDEPESIEAITLMVREFLWQNRDLLLFIESNKNHIEENLDEDGKKAISKLRTDLQKNLAT